LIKVSFQDELMRLDGALARTGTRCKSTGKGGHRTWLSCFTRLGNSQGSKLKSISYKIRLSRESLQVRNDWAAAGFKDTLLRCEMKPEVVHGNEKAIQPRVQA
jgi:hypothetical protein